MAGAQEGGRLSEGPPQNWRAVFQKQFYLPGVHNFFCLTVLFDCRFPLYFGGRVKPNSNTGRKWYLWGEQVQEEWRTLVKFFVTAKNFNFKSETFFAQEWKKSQESFNSELKKGEKSLKFCVTVAYGCGNDVLGKDSWKHVHDKGWVIRASQNHKEARWAPTEPSPSWRRPL